MKDAIGVLLDQPAGCSKAAQRWCVAVNATGEFGHWRYFLAWKVGDLVKALDAIQAGKPIPPAGSSSGGG